MKFGIISIDDSRAEYKERIRQIFSDYDEVDIPSFDARGTTTPLPELSYSAGAKFDMNGGLSRGEIGGWISHYRSWQVAAELDEPLLVFEDDAIIPDDFAENINTLVTDAPEGWDFIALCIPDDQLKDYMWINEYNGLGEPSIVGEHFVESHSQHYVPECRYLARAYTGYGHTAVLFAPKGAQALVRLANEVGGYTPADCFILNMSHANRVIGYAPKPAYASMVAKFNYGAESIIQNFEGLRQKSQDSTMDARG
jgi:GR25 family glycosyltransferase involved in LPS biosynthesis